VAEAQVIGRALVENRSAACVNIVPGLRSLFRWQGAIEDQEETLMLVKSRAERLPFIVETVKELHSYSVPEVIALPIIGGSSDYLAWIDESVVR
jgi:periplasmic divalent cation tolerance protein